MRGEVRAWCEPLLYDFLATQRGLAPNRGRLTVDEGSAGRPVLEFRMERGRSVAGQVLDADGAPAAGRTVAVIASFEDGQPFALYRSSVLTDGGGHFEIDSLPPQGGELGVLRPNGTIIEDTITVADDDEVLLTLPREE